MLFSDIYKGPRSPLAKLRHHPSSSAAASDQTSIAPAVETTPPHATPDWVNDEHADLLSRDKMKQKEAVKRYLSAKIRNDWVFTWPPASLEQDVGSAASVASIKDGSADGAGDSDGEKQADSGPKPDEIQATTSNGLVQDEVHDDQGYQVDDSDDDQDHLSVQDTNDTDTLSIYSIVSEDPLHYRPRMSWISDVSDSEPIPFSAPFRALYDDNVTPEALAEAEAKKSKQRREAREEAKWNEGLACFEARRNAWTEARTVRVRRKKMVSGASPKSGRRFFFRRSVSSSPPGGALPTAIPASQSYSAADTATTSDASSSANNEGDKLQTSRTKDSTASHPAPEATYPVQTLLPLAPPLLPPENCLRASINPTVYINLYEKVILASLQPSCPINLQDMIRSCVVGWQRDGEWPPRSIMNTTAAEVAAREAERERRKMAKREEEVRKKEARRKSSVGVEGGSNVARRMSFGLLGNGSGGVGGGAGAKEKEKVEDGTGGSRAGKGFRRSLQKALGMGGMAEGTTVR